jgi:hypothetical protein
LKFSFVEVFVVVFFYAKTSFYRQVYGRSKGGRFSGVNGKIERGAVSEQIERK